MALKKRSTSQTGQVKTRVGLKSDARSKRKTAGAETGVRSRAKKKAVGKSLKMKSVAKNGGATKSKSSKIVSLPNNMSQRSVEKAAVMKNSLDEYIRVSMYRIAYVSSMCFLLVGSMILLSETFPLNIQKLMVGQTSSALDTTSTSINTTSVIPITDIKFHSSIPDVVTKELDIYFEVFNSGGKVGAQLVPYPFVPNVSGVFPLLVNNPSHEKYFITITPGSLPDGKYQLRVSTLTMDQPPKSLSKLYPSTFHIGPLPTIYQSSSDTSNSGTSDTTTTDTAVSSSGTSDPATTEDPKLDTSTSDNTTDQKINDTTSDTISVTSGDAASSETVEPPVSFKIFMPDNDYELAGIERIGVIAPEGLTFIDLYYRQIKSIHTEYLGKAKNISGKWVFEVDTRYLPNEDYVFIAKTKYKESLLTSEPVKFRVRNEETIVQQNNYTTEEIKVPESESTKENSDPGVIVKIEDHSYVDEEPVKLTPVLDNESELFEKYRDAIRSGDEEDIEEARELIDDKINILSKSETASDSGDVAILLTERIENFKKRVDTFEKIRQDRVTGDLIDTDEDGISDVDEINLYKTDPESADSDNDGVSDSDEIIKGRDPVNESPEAIIYFESPKESVGLEREDILVLKEVKRVELPANTEKKEKEIKTEIRGKALPNSFVTIYIFSTPTVVTIKTDADGEFVYTFDKELEDGQHDVYVAMTDTAGEIIAQSNPFSFVKTAQAYTPVNAAEDAVVDPVTIVESSKNTYGTVVGMGILAFGLILLMLGISLRTKDDNKKPDDEESNDNDDSQDPETGSKPQFEHIDAT